MSGRERDDDYWLRELSQFDTDPGIMVIVDGDDLAYLCSAFAAISSDAIPWKPTRLRVWFDPLDAAVRFRFDEHTWSPPLGRQSDIHE